MTASEGSADLAPLRRDVARACRVMAHRGLVDDILGHVSARVGPEHLLVRCRGPRERGLRWTEAADVHLVDLDGRGELPEGYALPNELAIHTELLRRRPEVAAVVHAHPEAVVVAGLAGLALLPVFGAFNIPATRLAAAGIPTWGRSVLVRRRDLAAEMADAMGEARACVLRGHGLVTVGASVAEAVLAALDVQTLARIALRVVEAGGRLEAIPPEDLAELPDLGTGFNVEVLWRHHVEHLAAAGLDLGDA